MKVVVGTGPYFSLNKRVVVVYSRFIGYLSALCQPQFHRIRGLTYRSWSVLFIYLFLFITCKLRQLDKLSSHGCKIDRGCRFTSRHLQILWPVSTRNWHHYTSFSTVFVLYLMNRVIFHDSIIRKHVEKNESQCVTSFSSVQDRDNFQKLFLIFNTLCRNYKDFWCLSFCVPTLYNRLSCILLFLFSLVLFICSQYFHYQVSCKRVLFTYFVSFVRLLVSASHSRRAHDFLCKNYKVIQSIFINVFPVFLFLSYMDLGANWSRKLTAKSPVNRSNSVDLDRSSG